VIQIGLINRYPQYLLIKVTNHIQVRQFKTTEKQNVFEYALITYGEKVAVYLAIYTTLENIIICLFFTIDNLLMTCRSYEDTHRQTKQTLNLHLTQISFFLIKASISFNVSFAMKANIQF